MKVFVTIMCFAVAASVAAQHGYNYQQPKQSFRPTQHIGNNGIYSAQQAPPLASLNVPYQQQQQQFQQNFVSSGPGPQPLEAPPQYTTPFTQQFTPPANQYLAPASSAQYQPQQQTIISKDIFIHSAPEETEEIGIDRGVEAGPIRKNYRIVFIKAPAQNLKLNLASLKQAQASNEEKTIIYVLSKKPDLGNLQGQLAAVQNQNKAHKPEVYFIKYKTQDEANRAQQEIQAQYDSLGGSTSVTDAGVSSVTSVIGGRPVNSGSVGSSFPDSGSSFSSSAGPSFSSSGGSSLSGLGGSSLSGSAGSSFSGSVGPSFSGTSLNSGSNFAGSVQQQQFSQLSYQSSQGTTSSTVGIGGTPSQKYLPVSKK